MAEKDTRIVFLHGFMEDARIWEGFADRFSSILDVYCPNLPGHGVLPEFTEEPTMEAYATSLNSKLPGTGKSIFVGHSMGGYVALAYAEMFPSRVAGIILLNSTCFADSDARKLERDRSIVVMEENYSLFARSFVPSIFADAANPEIETLIKIALEQHPQGMIQSTRAMRNRKDRCPGIVGSDFPVLLIAGRMDKLIPAAAIDTFISKCPQADVEWFENSAHIAFIEEANRCESAVKDWLMSKGLLK